MSRAAEAILYSRADCHLCEFASQMLESCGVVWSEVDIETDLDLLRRYGTHVPVLYRPDVRRELYWPFNADTVREFLEHEI